MIEVRVVAEDLVGLWEDDQPLYSYPYPALAPFLSRFSSLYANLPISTRILLIGPPFPLQFPTFSLKPSTHLLHHRQNPRFRIIIPIRANPQIDLLVKRVLAIGSHQAEKRILGRLRYILGREGGGSHAHRST